MTKAASAILIAALALSLPAVAAEPVTRTYRAPDSAIATAVVVPPGYRTIYLQGMASAVRDASAPEGSLAAYGNTEQQTLSALGRIRDALRAEGADLTDVVSMKVSLVADPNLGGKIDFDGMMRAYRTLFGTTEQPNRPSRTTVQVAGLTKPGFLVEIETIAAVPVRP
ncbi:RidA family protein [Caulobacter henricii]|uniref:Endonuclease n=1 Tax=Caulobacter henricii TaxID=69395 RepID=A0A0P0P157_9CAUL|nr:RidA family protein [Caulobacter henricii]ALL14004.1 hypothetical protein AQ619_12005 [Caulobacter henricii]